MFFQKLFHIAFPSINQISEPVVRRSSFSDPPDVFYHPLLNFQSKTGISDHAKQLTLQLYHYSGTTGKTVSYEQKESEDAYIEEIGTVYDEDQAPEDLAVPVGDGITVDLQN